LEYDTLYSRSIYPSSAVIFWLFLQRFAK
jgi:hypothetical protein